MSRTGARVSVHCQAKPCHVALRRSDDALFPVERVANRRSSAAGAPAHENGVPHRPIVFEVRSGKVTVRCCTRPVRFRGMIATRAHREVERGPLGIRNASSPSPRTPGRRANSWTRFFGGMQKPPDGPSGTAIRATFLPTSDLPRAVPVNRTNPAVPPPGSWVGAF